MIRSTVVAIGLVAVTVGLAAGCSSDNEGTAGAEAPASTVETPAAADAGVAAELVIIDVRTPAEFAEGHLEGAINLDVESGAFETGLADLDPTASYAVYCRSGRRSAAAAEIMASNGYADVTDLGSLEQAVAVTGLPLATE